jgi:hypothetical protein
MQIFRTEQAQSATIRYEMNFSLSFLRARQGAAGTVEHFLFGFKCQITIQA